MAEKAFIPAVARRIVGPTGLRRIIAFLSTIAVFFTMNTFLFAAGAMDAETPDADALERIPSCGLQEHVHDKSCLDENMQVLCGMEEHTHTDACFQPRPETSEPKVVEQPVNSGSPAEQAGTTETGAEATLAEAASGTEPAPAEAAANEDAAPAEAAANEGATPTDAATEAAANEDATPTDAASGEETASSEEATDEAASGTEPVSSEEVTDKAASDAEPASSEEATDETTSDTEPAPTDAASDTEPASSEKATDEATSDTKPAPNDAATNEDAAPTDAASGEEPDASEKATAETASDAEPASSEKATDEAASDTEPASSEKATDETASDAEPAPTDAASGEETAPSQKATDEAASDTKPAPTDAASGEETDPSEKATDEAASDVEPAPAEAATNEGATPTDTVTDAEPAPAEAAAVESAVPAVENTPEEALPPEETAPAIVTLDFTNYVATDEHVAYLYDAVMVAVLVNADAIASVDGVEAVFPENMAYAGAPEAADNTLVITGNETYALNGVTYVVTGLTLPVSVIEGTGADSEVDRDKEITISTTDGEATLPDVEPVFKETAEGYADIFSLFSDMREEVETGADEGPFARIVDTLLGGRALAEELEIRTFQMKLFDIGLKDTDGQAVEPGSKVHITASFDGIEGEGFQLYHIVNNTPVLVKNAVRCDSAGRAVGFDFEIDSLSPFALVYYTVTTETGEVYTGYSLKAKDTVLNAQAILETLGIQAVADRVTCADEGVVIDGLSIALPEAGFTKVLVTVIAGLDWYEITLLAGDELEATAGDYTVALDLSRAGLDENGIYKVEIRQIPATDAHIAAVEAALSEDLEDGTRKIAKVSDLELVNIDILDVTDPESPVAVEPEGEVAVTLTRAGEAMPTVVHFLNDGTTETLDVVDGVFTTGSFSTFTGSYTVEFHYSDQEYIIGGATQVLLSTLIEKLGIVGEDGEPIDVANVASVSFTDERLVTVEEVSGQVEVNGETVDVGDKDFLLTSNEPFTSREQLVLTLADAGEIAVDVTDAQESANLAYFLTKLLINGAGVQGNNYSVRPNTDYEIGLYFAETPDLQFDNAQKLTYHLPDGIVVPKPSEPYVIYIDIYSRGVIYPVPATVSVDENGQVSVQFDPSNENFNKLAAATNVTFRVGINVQFTEEIDHQQWSTSITKNVVIDNTDYSDAFAQKSAVFDEKTGTYAYTVTVKAVNGSPQNVHVTDEISGDALIFNNDVQVSVDSSRYTVNPATSGFDYTFKSMNEGEVITITYSARLDPENIENGKLTHDNTLNTVTVKKEGGDPHTAEYSHTLDLKRPDKGNGVFDSLTSDGNRLYNWTIEYNNPAVISAAGDTVKDTIAVGARPYMKYYEDVTVQVYDSNDSLVKTQTVTPQKNYEWEYLITDTTPYRYVFTYQTIVDMSEVNDPDNWNPLDVSGNWLTLVNEAVGPGGESQGSVSVRPTDLPSITKSVERVTAEDDTILIHWVSTIHVPAVGLNTAVVTDTLPVLWKNKNLFDPYKEGSLEITGTLEEESYEVSYILNGSDISDVVITFYKEDQGERKSGLIGVKDGHDITIRLTTEVNQEWLKIGYDVDAPDYHKYYADHVNTIDINGIETTAKEVFAKPTIKKTLREDSSEPYFNYTITLSNVTEESFMIEDIFDTNLMEINTGVSYHDDFFMIFGGDQYNQRNDGHPVNYAETDTGITLNVNSLPKQANGEFYPYYKIVYYLKLKDGVDLHALAVQNGGTYDLTNTAQWGEHESSYTHQTTYDFLTKELIDDQPSATNRWAHYKITFNPDGGELNGGNPIKITDTLSANLSVDYASFQFKYGSEDVDIPYTIRGGEDGTTVATFIVPDLTSVTITYDAMVIGNGVQTYTNTVLAKGESKPVEGTVNINIDGDGTGSLVYLKITKVDKYDPNNKLDGVEFMLKKADGTLIKNYTTDNNGVLTIESEDVELSLNTEYILEEIEPKAGYKKQETQFRFTLTDNRNEVDHIGPDYVFFVNDTLQIENEPLEGLVVGKIVESDEEADLDKEYKFEVSILKNDRSVDKSVTKEYGDMNFKEGVAKITLKNGQQKSAAGMPVGTKFRVVETDHGELEPYYSIDGTNAVSGNSAAETTAGEYTLVTFTNRQKGSLKLKKKVTVNGSEDGIGTLADGTYSFEIKGPGENGNISHTVVITVTNSSATGAVLDNDKVLSADTDGFYEVTDLPAGDYTITETVPGNMKLTVKGGKTTGTNSVTVTVEDGITGNKVPTTAKATFTNNLPRIDIPVTKVWNDNNNQDGKRPASITVNLLADGTQVDRATVTGEQWTHTFANLDKFKDGKEIAYTVTEDTVEGYSVEITGSMTDGFTVTNSHEPEKVSVSATKAWKNIDNTTAAPSGASVVFTLYSDGKATDRTVTLDGTVDGDGEATAWVATFTGLEKYKKVEGTPALINYTVRETTGWTGYTANNPDGVSSGGTITNSQNSTSITVQKVWSDANNQDGKRGGVVATVTLKKTVDGTTEDVETVNVGTGDGWSKTWNGLAKYEGDKAVTYSVVETLTTPNDYTSDTTMAVNVDYGGTATITNSHTPEKVSVSATKEWDDNNNQDGIRPESITVNLLADGVQVDSVTLPTADGKWTYTFPNLNKYADGKEIVYTVEEAGVPDGYTATVNGFTITNTHAPEKTSVTVTKAWSDNDNQDGIRPESITVNLLADGVKVDSATVTGEQWTHTFANLDKFKDGQEIVYTVTEEAVEGYTPAYDGFTITNTHAPEKTSVTITKTWSDNDNQDGIRPESITVNLLADGVKVDSATVTGEQWTHTFANLDKFKDGKEIVYTVTEEAVEGYTPAYDGFTITNTHAPEKTSVTITKTWSDNDNQDGIRPESITVNLLADGVKVDSATVTGERWTHTFTNLDKFKDGKEIVYTVTEEAVEGYTPAYDGFKITNTHAPEKTSVTITKAWSDNDNQDGIRPESITVNLLADGVKVDSATVTGEQWTHTFANLDKFKDGQEIVYTVEEAGVPDGYTATVNGFTITNTHAPEKTSVPVQKVWNDSNDQDGARPESITVNLLANGQKVADATLSAANDWKYTFTELDKYAGGKEIAYTVTEETVENYTVEITGGMADGFTITNTLKTTPTPTPAPTDTPSPTPTLAPTATPSPTATPEPTVTPSPTATPEPTVTPSPTATPEPTATPAPTATPVPTHDINGRKVWIDENNIHLTRPESITVTLYADGQALDNRPIWTSTEGDTWSYTFANLPTVRENGATINYTVKETPVENYESTVNGFTITNRLIEKETERYVILAGAKTWDDHENAKGKRPNVITVRLFRDGVEIDSRDVTAVNGWTYSFGELPADDGYGNIYIYELREDAVPGYFQRVDGMNVINKLLDYDTPETPEGGTSDDDSIYQAKKARLEVLTRKTGSSRPRYEDYTEEELEELFDLFGYGTPLFGMLGTGDETPAYPFVFAGIGVIALAVALFIRRKRRYE